MGFYQQMYCLKFLSVSISGVVMICMHINVNKKSKSFIHRGMSERILWIEIYAHYYLTVFIINWDHFTGKFLGINMFRF